MVNLFGSAVGVSGKRLGWLRDCWPGKTPPPQSPQAGGSSHPLAWEELKAAAPPPRYNLNSSLNLATGVTIFGLYGGFGLALAEPALALVAFLGAPIAAFILGNVLYPPGLLAEQIYHRHALPRDYQRILSFSLPSERTTAEATQAAKILRRIQVGDTREKIAFSWSIPFLAEVVFTETLAPAEFDNLRKIVAEETSDENVLRKLALSPSAMVKEAVAINFASPPDVLEEFVDEFHVTKLSYLAAKNPNAPARSVAVFLSNVFERVLQDEETAFLPEVEVLVAIHASKRDAILEYLQSFSSPLYDLLATGAN
jgi:hypothetical protein